ncbi:MAG: hypothetical protein NC421_08220 [Lachnospiraceae bacterium]|nr:hypothetical protein [Lachnospiraceae bacterium]
MKKQINLIILGIAFMGGIAMAWQSNKANAVQSDTTLANIEAISEDEGDWDYEDGTESGRFECGAPLSNNGGKCTTMVVTCQGGGSGCNERKCKVHG